MVEVAGAGDWLDRFGFGDVLMLGGCVWYVISGVVSLGDKEGDVRCFKCRSWFSFHNLVTHVRMKRELQVKRDSSEKEDLDEEGDSSGEEGDSSD